jgi:hypothetical protein
VIKNVLFMLLTLAALGTAGVGCGGGSEASADITKRELLPQGDEIGWKALKTQDAAFQSALEEGIEEEATKFDPKKQKAFIKQVTGSVHGMVQELSDLGSPSGDESTLERISDAYESGASEAESNPQSYLSGNAFKKADAAAHAYGFKKCGSM